MAATSAMMMFGWLALRNSLTLEHSSRAFELSMACAEQGLLQLLDNPEYHGNETLVVGSGDCFILPIGGAGNENRTLCTEGTSGGVTRRMEVIIERLLPSIRIYAWQEADTFSTCSYE